MNLLHRLGAATAVRLRELGRSLGRDRGDNPVPTAVIIAGLVGIAFLLLIWAGNYIVDFMNQAPTQLPNPPQAP